MDVTFFYAYDKRLKDYLFKKGIKFNCTGRNVKTNDQFWQYTVSSELKESINHYNDIIKQLS